MDEAFRIYSISMSDVGTIQYCGVELCFFSLDMC